MATFRIHELTHAPYSQGSSIVSLPDVGGMTIQTALTTSGTSQQSASFGINSKFAIIESVGGAVYVETGTNPTASSATMWMAADRPLTVEIIAGQKISVIDV